MDSAFKPNGKFKLSRLKNHNLRTENIKSISKSCYNAYLGDYQSLCRILGFFDIYIDTRDRSIGMQLLMKGYWEIDVTECIAKHLSPGMNVIDVGANYGYFSLLMAGLIGHKTGKVYSIEASPNVFQHLKNSIRINFLGRI